MIGLNFPVAFIYDACFPTQRSVFYSLCYLFIFKPLSGWNTNHFHTQDQLNPTLYRGKYFSNHCARRDSNASLYYVRCNVYYYPAVLIHNIKCVGVLNTLEWTLIFRTYYATKFDTKNIFYDLLVQCILCTMCNHNAEYWRYTIYHLYSYQ